MKRIFVSVFAAMAVLGLYWLGGFDFDSRGIGAVSCAFYMALAFGAAYSFPGWTDGDR